jgi:hypothetical protein
MDLRIEKGDRMARWRRRVGFEQLETRHMLSHVLDAGPEPVVSVQIEDLEVPTSAVEFTAPVNISDGQGLRGAEIRLSYDTALLDVDPSSIHAGSIWPAHDTMVIANVDDARGTIHAWIFRVEGLDSGGGSLLDVGFRMTDSVRPGTTTALDLSSIRLNEDQIWSDPAPKPGQDTTDAAVRFAGAPARIDAPLSSIARPVRAQVELRPSVPLPVGWPSPIVQRGGRLEEPRSITLTARLLDHTNEPAVLEPTVYQGVDRPRVPDRGLLKKGTGSTTGCICPHTEPLLVVVPVPFFSRLDRTCVPSKPWPASEPSAEIGKPLADSNAIGPRQSAGVGRSVGQDSLPPIDELDRVLQQTESWLPQLWLPPLG